MNTNKAVSTFELTALSADKRQFKMTVNPYAVQTVAESIDPEKANKTHIVTSGGIFDILEDYEYVVKVWKDALKHNLNRFGARYETN